MKKIFLILSSIIVLHVCGDTYKQKSTSVPEWQNLGTIDIVPCPKKINITNSSIPVNDKLLIVIGKRSSVITETAANDLADIIQKKTSVKVAIVKEDSNLKNKHCIVLGTMDESDLIRKICMQETKEIASLESQGYQIFPSISESGTNLILAGKDPRGCYWAAITLAELIKKNKIIIAEVIDWPDFKWRVAESFVMLFRRKVTPKNVEKIFSLVKERIDYAARFKCNQFFMGSGWYSKPYTDYYTDERADLFRKIGDYALKRGMRLYFVMRASTGVIGRDEKQFPQLKKYVKESRYYYTWSDDEVIDYACSRIKEMVRKIGPHVYLFHPPDIPNIGWGRRSESDRKKWNNDRISAEAYIANKFYRAVVSGNNEAKMFYHYCPYSPEYYFNGDDKAENYQNLINYGKKFNPNIGIGWREHSMETAEKLKNIQKKRTIEYMIEDKSWHKNRLIDGVPRTYKSYLFPNSENDVINANISVTSAVQHLPMIAILAEYAWNTNAPGSTYVIEKSNIGNVNHIFERLSVADGIDYASWIYGLDMEGVFSKELLPRICRLIFGEKVGNDMAIAYSGGGTIHEDNMGGTALSSPVDRYLNSINAYKKCRLAAQKLEKYWKQPELFNNSPFNTYVIYESVFKYVRIYQYIERLNAWAKLLDHIEETGKDIQRIDSIYRKSLAFVEQARNNIARDYAKYNFEKIHFKAVYRQKIGNLQDVYKKIDRIKKEITFRVKQIKEFGPGRNHKNLKNDMIIGIPATSKSIKIDGRLNEWDLSSPIITDKTYLVKWLRPGGIVEGIDYTGFWFFRHDNKFLYVAALIYDNSYVFKARTHIYNNDAVELWLNKEQIIISSDNTGEVIVEPYGKEINPRKIKACIKKGIGEYPFYPKHPWWVAEIKVPLSYAGITNSNKNNEFYFAFGTDDIDQGEDTSQFFFPDTYEHLRRLKASMKNFAKAVLCKDKYPVKVQSKGFKLKNVVMSENTYTCFDLDFTLDADRIIPGLQAEVRMYTPKGIRRFILDIPHMTDKCEFISPLHINTKEYYHELENLHFELLIQTPVSMQIITLQKGANYRKNAPFISRETINIPKLENLYSPPKQQKPAVFLSFDNESLSNIGTKKIKNIKSHNISYVDGKRGKAVKIDKNGYIIIEQNFIKPEGAKISFWFKPLFTLEDHARHTILKIFDSYKKNRVYLYNNARYSYALSMKGESKGGSISFKPHEVFYDRWNYFQIYWNLKEGKISFILNGNEKTVNTNIDMTQVSKYIYLGTSTTKGLYSAPCIIDELKIEEVGK